MEHDFVVITDYDDVVDDSDDNLRQSYIAKYLSSPAGRSALAQSMVQPLRRNLDYHSIGRKIFMVQDLPQGALPVYFPSPPDKEDE